MSDGILLLMYAFLTEADVIPSNSPILLAGLDV